MGDGQDYRDGASVVDDPVTALDERNDMPDADGTPVIETKSRFGQETRRRRPSAPSRRRQRERQTRPSIQVETIRPRSR